MSVADDAEKALRIVREAPVMAYDTETSGVDWKRNFPVGYVFTVDWQTSLYVPIRHGGGGNLPDAGVRVPESATDAYQAGRFEKALATAFADRNRQGFLTVGHHLKFDAHMSANVGIYIGRGKHSDTQNNEAMLDEYARHYSLEASAERRKVTAKKGEELYQHLANMFGGPADRKSMANFWQLPGDDPIGRDYAAGDGVSTIELYNAQLPLMEEEGLMAVKELEDDLIWTLFRMERRGIRVDEEYLQKTLEYIATQVENAERDLPPDFNVRSPVQLRRYLETAGRTDWPTTDLGNPSYTEKWLKTFPEGQKIVKVRKWTHLKNSFIMPLLEDHVFNGRVHANINQLKSDDSGSPARLSCSNPNMMAIPKRDKELAPMFRKAFIPDDGYTFFEDDYSQCEPCLFAHYSQDPRLLEGYRSKPRKDVHMFVAELLDVERDPTAKRMNMGIFTGMYPKTFAEHMGWPLDLATEKWNAWFEAFPNVKDFQDKAKHLIEERGWVKTLLGRRGRLEHPRFAYKATSKIIQGGNADILKKKLLDIDRYMESTGDVLQILMSIHDAYEGQFESTKLGRKLHKEMLAMMVDVQTPPFNLRVPFAVDAGTGADWAEASFGAK